MTDQSRVEAVARALCAEEGRDPDVWYLADDAHRQSWCLFKSRAQAAIDANDAWLIQQQQATAKQFYKTMNERHRRLKERTDV